MRRRKLPAKEYADNFAVASGRSTIEERYLKTKTSEFSRNLKMLRATIRMTSSELAQLSGLSHSLIRSVESGYRTLLLEPALMISLSTGVDLWSLLTGNILREWGGVNPYTEHSYKEWTMRGYTPSEEQDAESTAQLEVLCKTIMRIEEAGPAGKALASGYLRLLGNTFEEGIKMPGG